MLHRLFARAIVTTAAVVVGTTGLVSAQAPATFTNDVAPILFDNCVSCHRPGEVAPMPLRSHEEVRPWARAIKDKVVTRKMPPWFPDPNFGTFKDDARLTEQEIETIAQWVDAGAPRGDPADLPDLPAFADGWGLGEPDHILMFPEVTVPAEGDDYYPDIALTVDLLEKRWIRAIEIRPSNRQLTHHSVIFTTGQGERGPTGFFDILAVWSVGTNPHEFPEGMGRWNYPGQELTVNAHYHPSGKVETDRTRVGLYFGEGEIQKEVIAALAGTMAFEIPPRAENHELRSSYIIDQDVSVISYFPHMHWRGQDMKLVANYPNGETQTLISVPEYDFDWQLFYYPDRHITLPKGTRLDIVAHYDNSAANPNNPDPDRAVTFGLQTTDEMMFTVVEFYVDEGVSPVPASAETRRDALLVSLPVESAYRVGLPMGQNTLPTVLHLPKNGEGTWYIPMGGNLMVIPAQNITWDENTYRFDMQLRMGPMSGDFVIEGTVGEDGAIQGKFEGSGFVPFSGFEGTRAGDN